MERNVMIGLGVLLIVLIVLGLFLISSQKEVDNANPQGSAEVSFNVIAKPVSQERIAKVSFVVIGGEQNE